MEEHRRTCISRLAELAEDPELLAAVIYALTAHLDTSILSLCVQHVMELRDNLADNPTPKGPSENPPWLRAGD